MLQFIHRFKKTLLAFVFLSLAAVSLVGIGLGSGQFGGDRASIESVATVNSETITYKDLARARNDGQVPAQQALDALVDRTVVRLFAERAGLAAGEGTIRQTLMDIAPGGMTAQGVAEMLGSLGMTVAEFEREIQKEGVSRQLYAAISAAVVPSKLELAQGIKEFSVVKTVSVASARAEAFLSQTAVPSDEVIEEYYRQQTSDFEIPAAIAYDYVVFNPEKYREGVVVTDEDIELYYADNQREFAIPATVTAQHIQLLYPKEAKPEALNETRERAQRAHARAQAGEAFEALVLEFSDDLTTKLSGGNLGEVSRGKRDPAFDAAVFKLKEPGLAELIEADYGFEIVKVTGVAPETTKSLASVKDQIRAKLQEVDAPAYASARASEMLAEWRKLGAGLKEFASSRGLVVASAPKALTKQEDPSAELKGLTAAVFVNGDAAKQQAELDRVSVLVEVTARREADVAGLSTVKEQISKIIRTREAAAILRAKSEELAKLSNLAEFEKTAKTLGFTVAPQLDVKSQEFTPPAALNHGDLFQKVRRAREQGILAPVIVADSAYVGAIKSIKDDLEIKPEQGKMQRQIVAQQLRYELGSLVEKSLLAQEKRVAKIEIKPGAYND